MDLLTHTAYGPITGLNVGYLSINGERGSQTVDEGDEVTITFTPGPGFPSVSVSAWELYLDGVLVDGETSEFDSYVIDAASEADAGSYRLELTIGAKVVRVSATLAVSIAGFFAGDESLYAGSESIFAGAE
jgi:hypothetical protein